MTKRQSNAAGWATLVDACAEIAKREHCSVTEVMREFRRDPELYAPLAKSAPPSDWNSLVAIEITKGCTPEVAGQRVAQMYGIGPGQDYIKKQRVTHTITVDDGDDDGTIDDDGSGANDDSDGNNSDDEEETVSKALGGPGGDAAAREHENDFRRAVRHHMASTGEKSVTAAMSAVRRSHPKLVARFNRGRY